MNRVLAQALTLPFGPDDTPVDIAYPDTYSGFAFQNIGQIISNAIPIILALAGVGLLLMILSAGFTLLTSGGDTKKLETGKQRLTYAVIGFIIVFAAWWLVQIAARVFGLTEFQSIFQ